MLTTETLSQPVVLDEGDVNAGAICAVVAYIELDPSRWNQRFYQGYNRHDRPTLCFAAWTCKLAGYSISKLLRDTAQPSTVFTTAQRLLGLTDAQAAALFYADVVNATGEHPTIEEFKLLITEVTGVVFP